MEKDNALLETNDIEKVLERKSFKFVLKYLRMVVSYDFVSLKNKSFGGRKFWSVKILRSLNFIGHLSID